VPHLILAHWLGAHHVDVAEQLAEQQAGGLLHGGVGGLLVDAQDAADALELLLLQAVGWGCVRGWVREVVA
jgi:hypothetical protein